MKKFYTKMMALACMFLLVGANAWAGVETWTGTSISLTNNQWNQVTTSFSVKGAELKYDKTVKGIKFGHVNINTGVAYNTMGYFKASQDGAVVLTVQSYKDEEKIEITEETTNFHLLTPHSQASNSTQGAGYTISLEVKAGKEYFIHIPNYNNDNGGNAFFFKKVEFVTADSYLLLDETASKVDNENAITTAHNNNVKFVKLHRTLKAGQWNTLCLPFPLNATYFPQLNCDAIYELTGYDSEKNEATFTAKTTYVSNKPCLIKPNEDIVDPVIESNVAVTLIENNHRITVNNTLTFVSVFGVEDIYTTGLETSTKFYLNNQGKFVYPTSNDGNNGKIKGLRGYFEWANGVPAHSSVKDMTCIIDDDATGLRSVEKDIFNENATVYSIDGRNMGNSKDNLSRGIYIQNGRKFIVK